MQTTINGTTYTTDHSGLSGLDEVEKHGAKLICEIHADLRANPDDEALLKDARRAMRDMRKLYGARWELVKCAAASMEDG